MDGIRQVAIPGSRELGGQNGGGVQRSPNRFLTPDLTTPEA